MPGDFDVVKERIDLVQLVGEKVALKRARRTYKGLCPFHAEKTPSFTVDPEHRTYKCFGSGDTKTEEHKAQGILWEPLKHFEQHPERMPAEHQRIAERDGTKRGRRLTSRE